MKNAVKPPANRIAGAALPWLLTLALLAAGPACQDVRRPRVIKLGHGLDRTHSVHVAMEFMAQRLREKSGGQLELQIYPSEQLGGEREMVELLQLGSVGMTKISAAVMESFAPEYKIFSVPYLFDSKEHQFRVLDGPIGKRLLTASEPFMLRVMAYYDSGSRSFYTRDRPIEKPADLAGLKIRVMKSATSIKMVRALGGAATPIPFGELYTALQQGVVDGAENNPPSFYLSRHYEQCKFYSLDEHATIPDLVLIGTPVWSSLSEQERRWLQEAADESVVYQRKLWTQSEEESLAALEKAGVKLVKPDKRPFQALVEAMHEEYAQDREMAELMTAIKALR